MYIDNLFIAVGVIYIMSVGLLYNEMTMVARRTRKYREYLNSLKKGE